MTSKSPQAQSSRTANAQASKSMKYAVPAEEERPGTARVVKKMRTQITFEKRPSAGNQS